MSSQIRAEQSPAKGTAEGDEKARFKKMPPESVAVMFAGDLMLARCKDRAFKGFFRRFEILLESFANMEKQERLLNYRFFIALALTAHARRAESEEEKKELFEKKNQLFLDIANNRHSRKQVGLKYLVSPQVLIIENCPKCLKENEESGAPLHKRKHCKDCKVDSDFFNLLSMMHKFEGGSVSIFISQDRIHQVKHAQTANKGKRDDVAEELRFRNISYNPKNLNVLEKKGILKAYDKLLSL